MPSEGVIRGIVIAGMLIFGTCTVVLQKIIFKLKGKNRAGETGVEFEKPWFQTEAMFVGMFGCLAVYEILECVKRCKGRDPARQKLMDSSSNVQTDASGSGKKVPSKGKQYVLVMAPALCDMCATAMMNIGLLWINPSVWQMLRGSMTIFSAFFSKFFLKRHLYASHWIGVCVVAFALVVVAFSSLMPGIRAKQNGKKSSESSSKHLFEDDSTSNHSDAATVTQVAIGCSLVVFAQIIQASQIVIEEFLLKNISLNPVLIVGLEGMWGFISCAIVLVIVTFIPPPIHEDSLDTLYMFFVNPNILGFGLLYMAVILCYNLFGMFVTQYTSAVMRTILEGLRCACIWITNLFIRYVIIRKSGSFGEEWNDWSYLQLCGFFFLLLGMFLYNQILRIEGLYYEDRDPELQKKKAQEQPTIEVPTDE